MENLYEYRKRMLARFQAIVDDLEQAIDALSQAGWYRPLEPGGWSAHQVLVHLRDADAHAYLPRLLRILAEDTPFVEDFDDGSWMAGHYNPEEPIAAILAECRELRSREIACLERMSMDGWSRMGRHPGWGLRSIQWWVERSLAHSEEHLRQIRQSQTAGI